MNKRIHILLVLLLLSSASIFGQFVGKDNLSVALYYVQKSELDSAQKYVDIAITDEALRGAVKTWYYRGYIYKDLYKLKEKSNKTSPLRLTAIASFKTMLTLEGKEEFTESTYKMLKYLASTLYNDAAGLLGVEKYEAANTNYDHFKAAMTLRDSNVDLKSQDVKFKSALASRMNRPKNGSTSLDSTQTYQVKILYKEVLAIEPNNPGANYNLAIIYYNEGADIINEMDYDMDMIKLNEVQDKCIDIFLAGLPYMKKSYELNYRRKETLIGLSNIYYGLNDHEKYDAYKKELLDLEKGE